MRLFVLLVAVIAGLGLSFDAKADDHCEYAKQRVVEANYEYLFTDMLRLEAAAVMDEPCSPKLQGNELACLMLKAANEGRFNDLRPKVNEARSLWLAAKRYKKAVCN